MYVEEEGRHFVRHHLIDFSSTLGSGSDARKRIAAQNPRAGNEYIVELRPGVLSALTFGIWERPWRRARFEVHPEIGRIEADFFRPQSWRPEYPNPAAEYGRHVSADSSSFLRYVDGFSDYAEIVQVADRLLARGYGEDDVHGILGENYLRLFDQVWVPRA